MTFAGRLFDGQHSGSLEVLVSPLEGGLRLEADTPVFWAWSELPKSALTRTGTTVVLTRGRQTLEVRDPNFVPALRQAFPRADLFRSPFHTWTSTPGRFALTMGSAVAALAFAFLVVVPGAGDLVAASLPPELERAAGETLRTQLVAGLTILEPETERLQEFWDRLELPTQKTTVTVVDDGYTANAFALMGGQVIVYRGLLDRCQTPHELAGVLAHEAAHGELHHSARLIGRSMAGAFLLSYLLSDPTGITGAVLGNVDSLRNLQFSREMEAEADAWSVKVLEGKADSRALGQLLWRLDDFPLPSWANFLGDHPGTAERMRFLQSQGRHSPLVDGLGALFDDLKYAPDAR